MRLSRLAPKKTFSALTAVLLGLFLLFPAGGSNSTLTSLPNAEASFFSNDLELFEEVIGLVGDKYVYALTTKKCSWLLLTK